MPITIPNDLPAYQLLFDENPCFLTEYRQASYQGRRLKIGILNLMPNKIETENQLLRYLAMSEFDVEIVLLKTETYKGTHTSEKHLKRFYTHFHEVKGYKFDGLIITGAPVETLTFDEVLYWDELKEIMEWTKTNVQSTLHICWGAVAGLYYHYQIPKIRLKEKMFGVFKHHKQQSEIELLNGIDELFDVPHSRHSGVDKQQIEKNTQLDILAESDEAGVLLMANKTQTQIFIMGHVEYDSQTLNQEYVRDKEKGYNINIPKYYFLNDDANGKIVANWEESAKKIFSNWLKYSLISKKS